MSWSSLTSWHSTRNYASARRTDFLPRHTAGTAYPVRDGLSHSRREQGLSAQLCGHEKGSFTGASARRFGLVEAAAGGTLFLDELGDIPLGMQVKLLRLLETGTFRRVGASDFLKSDVRLISATHRNLRTMVAEGHFRQDLYFRLNTFPIALPALRERLADVPLLAETLLARVAPGHELHLSKPATCTTSFFRPHRTDADTGLALPHESRRICATT